MKEKEILEGNKLIAEFMGAKPIDNPTGYSSDDDKSWYRYNNLNYSLLDGDLKFYSSWDWLMPVVQKICPPSGTRDAVKNAMIVFMPYVNGCVIEYNMRQPTKLDKDMCDVIKIKNEATFIQAVWKAIVEFIKWYNEQTKK